MEHKNLSIEVDKNLIEKVLDDLDMKYVILFLYIIRNDLFKDLKDPILIENYEKILILDEIFKSNINRLWDENFTEIAIDLGLLKNIRTLREFQQKESDFLIKLGEETITIEENTISVPDDSLFLIINKKFKPLSRRNFNISLTKLKGVRCEKTSNIHPLIYEIGEHDYAISDDLYYILDQYGNIYQTIKIELTIEGFYERFSEIQKKVENFLEVFDPKLTKIPVKKKIEKAIEENKEIIKYLKDEGIELSGKFSFDKIDPNEEIFQLWKNNLLTLINLNYKMKSIDNQLIELKRTYSGKDKVYSYLEFIEKISYNEGGIVDNIQSTLIDLRSKLIEINEELSKFSKKELQLLNLEYEKFVIMSSEN